LLGAIKQVTASKEVVLCGGVIGSPQVLLNSGIGKSSDLSAVGVTPIVDLPDVGANMVDHGLVFNKFLVNSTDTYEKITRDPAAANASLSEWMKTHDGFFSDTITSHISWNRLPKDSPFIKEYGDSSAGPVCLVFRCIEIWVVIVFLFRL
jgi:choline dehydrogenase-like flavoprotein